MKCTRAPLARTALSLLTRTVDPCLATMKCGHLFSISVGHSLTTESYTHHHTHSHTQARMRFHVFSDSGKFAYRGC